MSKGKVTINKLLKMTRTGRGGRKLTIRIENGYFVIGGGETGDHPLAIGHTDAARLEAHFDGYCRENGWRPTMTQAEMRARWEHEERTGERMCAIAIGSAESWAKHLKGRY